LNTTGEAVNGVFTYPASDFTGATVCSCDITFGGKTFSSAVINPEAQKLDVDPKLDAVTKGAAAQGPTDPKLFSMPFHGLSLKGEIVVELRFVQEMSFDSMTGMYSLKVPMSLPANGLYEGRTFEQAIRYNAIISTGSNQGMNWVSDTSKLDAKFDEATGLVTLNGTGDSRNLNFHLGYSAWRDTISGSTLVQPSGLNSGSFVTFLRPSSDAVSTTPLPRRIVFLIDHSYSMSSGTVMGSAKEALLSALDLLRSQDSFTICAFDHQQKWYSGNQLRTASDNEILQAKEWVKRVEPEGTTELLAPYKHAAMLLNGPYHGHAGTSSGGGFGGSGGGYGGVKVAPEEPLVSLPIIILITDGAVGQDQDKALMKFAAEARHGHAQAIRTFTFGIGPYCNRYLLNQLADAGSGYSQVCLDCEDMKEKMMMFLSKTKSPVLMDVNVAVPSGLKLDIFPSTIPDLTVGAPLVICGRYSGGEFPSNVVITGKGVSGAVERFVFKSSVTEHAPISTLVERARLDILVGKWYMCEDAKQKNDYKQRAIEASLASSLPCVFTQAVAYECPVAVPMHSIEQAPAGFEGPKNVGKADQFSPTNNKNRVKRAGNSHTGLKVGAAVLLGGGAVAAAFAFGNASATLNNLPSADAMIAIGADGFNAIGDLAGQGWDAVAAVDWRSIGGGLGDAMSSVGDWVGGAVGTIGEFGGDAIGVVGEFGGDAISAVGEFGGDAIGAISEFGGSAISAIGEFGGDAIGAIGEFGGDAIGAIGEFGGGAVGFIGEVAGDIGPGLCSCLGGVGDCLGDIVKTFM